MIRIYNILTSILGESKQGSFSKDTMQYQFCCPWETEERDGIPDGKYNCEVSFSLGVFHSWCCDNKGPISYLIKKWGNKDLVSEYYSIIKDLKESKYYNLDLFKDDGTFRYEEQIVKLPKTFKKIDINSLTKSNLRNYLAKRKITQDIIDFYNIGYTSWDKNEWQVKDRIIIPSYDINGDINYWVGRDFTGSPNVVKYRNCNADKKRIVLHEDKIQWDADIVLVEGALDCIYYPNSIALMGKALKKDYELYKVLQERANADIIICLDSDTKIEETKKIYNLLNTGRLFDRIKYVRLGTDELPWKDFGEAYEAEKQQGIIKILKSAKKFSFIEL